MTTVAPSQVPTTSNTTAPAMGPGLREENSYVANELPLLGSNQEPSDPESNALRDRRGLDAPAVDTACTDTTGGAPAERLAAVAAHDIPHDSAGDGGSQNPRDSREAGEPATGNLTSRAALCGGVPQPAPQDSAPTRDPDGCQWPDCVQTRCQAQMQCPPTPDSVWSSVRAPDSDTPATPATGTTAPDPGHTPPPNGHREPSDRHDERHDTDATLDVLRDSYVRYRGEWWVIDKAAGKRVWRPGLFVGAILDELAAERAARARADDERAAADREVEREVTYRLEVERALDEERAARASDAQLLARTVAERDALLADVPRLRRAAGRAFTVLRGCAMYQDGPFAGYVHNPPAVRDARADLLAALSPADPETLNAGGAA